MIDPSDPLKHHIFFDDNIWIHDYKEKGTLILDIRDLGRYSSEIEY